MLGGEQWRTKGGVWGVQTPPPKFRRPSKIVPNSTRLWKLLKIAEFRTPTPQDGRRRGSKILKLRPVRNCFTLAMTNKLVVIINSLKVQKIKKILLYEMKFLVPNYICLRNPWLGCYRPQIPVLSVLNWICWTPPPRTKFLGTPLEGVGGGHTERWKYCLCMYVCILFCVISGHNIVVGPCHHGMARPQVAGRGTASDMEGSCE